jgi:hypothetical protein
MALARLRKEEFSPMPIWQVWKSPLFPRQFWICLGGAGAQSGEMPELRLAKSRKRGTAFEAL